MQQIEYFLPLGDQLWAWSRASGSLFKRTESAWTADPQRWQQITGDDEALLMLSEQGALVLRTTSGDHTLIPALEQPLPLQSSDDIIAFAELGDTLFLALNNGKVLSYHRVQHAWEVQRDLEKVAQFETIGKSEKTVFARTTAGRLWRYVPARKSWLAVQDPVNPHAIFASIVSTQEGDQGMVITQDGHVLFLGKEGDIIAAHRPLLLFGENTQSFTLAAATEVMGRLVLVPRSADTSSRLWVYDPTMHAWTTHQLQGNARAFLRADQSTWLTLRAQDGKVYLRRIEGEPPKPGMTLGPFLDAASDGKLLLVVTPTGNLQRLSGDGVTTPLPLANATLPEGRSIHHAVSLGDACAVLLNDGSVYHYTRERQWVEKVPPLDHVTSAPGSFVSFGGASVLFRASGEVWQLDRASGNWYQLAELEEGMPAQSPQRQELACEVSRQQSGYTFSLQQGSTTLPLQLEGTRFNLDRVEGLVFHADSLWLRTPAGVRQYRHETDGWREQLLASGQFPQESPDPLVFAGNVFSAHREAKGAFPTTGAPLTLTMQLGSARLALRPAHNHIGAGFAHDIIRDAAPTRAGAWLATPGGAVMIEVRDRMARVVHVDGPEHGLSDADLIRIITETDRIVVESRQGSYRQRPITQAPWASVGVEVGRQAFAMAASITRANATSHHWKVMQDNTGKRLQLDLGSAGQIPVSLSTAGFGFDRPHALSLGGKKIRLYTSDGLLEFPQKNTPVPVDIVQAAYALPAELRVPANALEIFQGDRLTEVWLHTPQRTWQYTQNAWRPANGNDYLRTLRSRRPYHWQRHGVKWGKDDQVEMQLRDGTAPFLVQYDPTPGRFHLDMPLNLTVYHDKLWTVTRGGVVLYSDDGSWQAVMLAGQTPPFDEKARLVVLSHSGRPRLFLMAGTLLLEWHTEQWQPPADHADMTTTLRRLESYVLDGNHWQLTRADAQTAPYKFRARLVAKEDFVDVQLLGDGRFDFEQVKTVAVDGLECHVASQFGLARLDTRSMEFLALTRWVDPIVRLGRLQKQLYARLTSGQELEYTNGQWRTSSRRDVFATIDTWLINESPWRWQRTAGGQVRIQLEPATSSLWQGSEPLDVQIMRGRFGFDAVLDVGHADLPWLATEAGLLARQGPKKQQLTTVVGEVQPARSAERLLFPVVPDQQPALYARLRNGLHTLRDGRWQPVPSDQLALIDTLAKTQVAKNAHYGIQKEGQGEIKVSIHLAADPPGVYKQVEFDSRRGKFTFDVFNKVARKAVPNTKDVLVATEGGVVAYSLTDPQAWKLYADQEQDGLGLGPVRDIVFAKRENVNLLINSRNGIQRLERTTTKEQWRPGTEGDRDTLERVRKMVVDDPDAWQVRDQPEGAGRFQIKWRNSTVRLVDMRQTDDIREASTRFAHDIPLSAVLTQQGLWVGTRGGAVLFHEKKFDVHSDQTLPMTELREKRPPAGIGLIRTGGQGQTLYARREGDGTVLRYTKTGWETVSPEDAGWQQARISAKDSLWRWTKDSRAPVKLTPEAALQVPENYAYIHNGTWAFLETGHVTQRDPRRTIVVFQDHLYMATAGGIARFPLPSAGQSANQIWPEVAHNFIDTVYARAREGRSWVAMQDIIELFVDRNTQLYARSRAGRQYVFQPGENLWLVYSGPGNPLDRANEIVDNALFKWRVKENGAFDIQVQPLLQDMPEQSTYGLFSNGRFAFDEVYAFERHGGRLWLASDGGVCLYRYEDFKAERFVARPFIELETRRSPQNAGLARVRELVHDPEQPSRLLSRTASGAAFELHRDTFSFTSRQDPSTSAPFPEEVFTRAYTRERLKGPHYSMHWVQYPFGSVPYPEGALKVFVGTASGHTVALGAQAIGADMPLFSRQRFAFDDVRAVVLHGASLFTATPVGVLEHSVDWGKQQAPMDRLHSFASSSHAPMPQVMKGLDRMVRFANSAIMTWGDVYVFETVLGVDSDGLLRWQVNPSLRAEQIGPTMILPDRHEHWQLQAYQQGNNQPMTVAQIVDSKPVASREVHTRFKPTDVSVAVIDTHWIYLPDPRGGLFRIRKGDIQ